MITRPTLLLYSQEEWNLPAASREFAHTLVLLIRTNEVIE